MVICYTMCHLESLILIFISVDPKYLKDRVYFVIFSLFWKPYFSVPFCDSSIFSTVHIQTFYIFSLSDLVRCHASNMFEIQTSPLDFFVNCRQYISSCLLTSPCRNLIAISNLTCLKENSFVHFSFTTHQIQQKLWQI